MDPIKPINNLSNPWQREEKRKYRATDHLNKSGGWMLFHTVHSMDEALKRSRLLEGQGYETHIKDLDTDVAYEILARPRANSWGVIKAKMKKMEPTEEELAELE